MLDEHNAKNYLQRMENQINIKAAFFLLLFVAVTNFVFSQKATLVYDCQEDSNDYLSELRDINGRLFFVSGKIRNPKGVAFCGNGGPRIFKEGHIFEYDFEERKAKKHFHHYLENDFAQAKDAIIDSSKIVTRHTFFALSDGAGVFLPHSGDSSCWLKINDDFVRKTLPTGHSISDYYPERVNGKLMVQGKIADNSGKIWAFDTINYELQNVIEDTFLLKRHNYQFLDDKVIFHAYAKLYGKDNGLYLEKTPGEIIKISKFPTASVFATFQAFYQDKIIYRITHRGKIGSYTNTDFNNTELWSYNIEKDTSERIFDFGKYCLTYAATTFNNNLYLTFGKGEYRLFQLGLGDITEKNDSSGRLKSVKPKFTPFNEKLYFVGLDSNAVENLYSLDKQNNIKVVRSNFSDIKIIKVLGDKLFFRASIFGTDVNIFSISGETERIRQYSHFNLEKKVNINPVEIGGNIFWFIRQNNETDLYLTTNQKIEMKLILRNIAHSNQHQEKNYFIKDNKLFVLAASIDSEWANQIWKIE